MFPLLLKAFHLIFMVTWFAGLFYLPRLYVYHSISSVVNLLSLSRVCNALLMASIGHSGRVFKVSSG
jgi:putative membrane protein